LIPAACRQTTQAKLFKEAEMSIGGGYRDREAWIDLSKGKVEYKPIKEDDARKYVGARGLGDKYVYDNGP
jgi:aldehyde:ferredoxin oxidoreductase